MIEPNSDTQRLTAEQIRGKAEYKRWFACAVDPEGTAITPALSGQPLGSRETSWRRSHSPAIRSLLLPSGTTCQCTATAFRYGTQKVHGPVSTSHSQRSSLGPARERSLFPTPRDLLMIGRAYLIKPRWVECVMAKQLADGGWSWKS